MTSKINVLKALSEISHSRKSNQSGANDLFKCGSQLKTVFVNGYYFISLNIMGLSDIITINPILPGGHIVENCKL